MSSLLKNGLYNALNGLVRAGLVLLTIPLLTRFLGIQEYGVWSLVSAVLELIVLTGNGISVTTTIFTSRDLAHKDRDRSLSSTLTVIGGGVFLLATMSAFGLFIGSQFLPIIFSNLDPIQTRTAIDALQIASLVVWSRLLQQVLVGVEQGFQQYGYLNILNTIQALALSIGAIWIAWHGGKIVELMQWQALVYGLLLISHLWLVRKLLKSICLEFIWHAERASEIGKHSLTNLFLCIGSVIFGRGDRIAVAYFLSPEILGIYAVITDVTAGMNTLSTLPVQPLISSLGSYVANEASPKHKLKYQVKQSLELSATLALGIGVWLFALAPLLMQELLASSADNANAIIALRIAIAIYSLISINAVGFYTLLTLDVALCMKTYIISASIALSLIILGATKFGLVGALAGNIGFILSWSMLFSGMKKLNLSKWFWLRCLKFPLVWFLVSISIVSLVGNNLIPSIGIASLGTLALAYWFIGAYKENKVLATV